MATSSHIRFERTATGFEQAICGVWTVGLISPAQRGDKYPHYWRCFLPGCRNDALPAASMEKARGALVFTIDNWMEGAGYVLSAALTAQARKRREAKP